MPVTDCIKDSPKWISGFSVLSLIYLIVAIYSVVSLKRYWRVFKDQTFLSILSRISFSITLFLKFFGIFASLLIGLYAHTRNNSYVFSLCGLFLLEFPCYMVALSFTIVLLNWLSMCLQILPAKYTEDPALFPPSDVLDNCEIFRSLDRGTQDYYSKLWKEIKLD